jgi:glycosyltransferase involved in cell wall biosynthesis
MAGISQTLNRVFETARSRDAQRRSGDRARDAQLWNEAADHYAEFLKLAPNDAMIRVQLGNCLKEAGRLTEAMAAYDLAIERDPKSDDAHLQRGHLLKKLGRKSEAIDEYRKSFELKPNGNSAFEELLTLGGMADIGAPNPTAAVGRAAAPIIHLDVTDLIDYLRVNTTLSGIQRVVSKLIAYGPEFGEVSANSPVVPVLPDYNGSRVLAVRMDLLAALIGLVGSGRSNRDLLDRALDAVLGSRSSVTLRAGDTLLIAGAFWIYQRYDLPNMLRHAGVRVTVFIHDLIQITDPEFVEPAATTVFRRSIVDVLSVCNYVLTNSHFVAGEVGRYLTERMNFQIPVIPVTLATEFSAKEPDINAVHQEYKDLATEEYVLCVGTIEIRKNHLYLINIWERLIKEGKRAPNLVFVGKWGWEIAPLQKHLSKSDYLGGRLYIYNAISDDDLSFLYQNCLFTIYPSFAEGWGLPVGESLWYGKPCITSRVTAMPEVGGSLCKYLDPFDAEDGYRVVADVLAERPALAAWTAQVRAEFKPKTWKGFSMELFETVQRCGNDEGLGDARNNVIVESGEIATFGNDPLAQIDAKGGALVTARMSRMVGWHGIEAWGCWAARRRATLRINTRMEPGADALVYLHLKTQDGDESADCTIKINDSATFIDGLGAVPTWHTVAGKVGEQGAIDITLISGRGFCHSHGRELYVGILGIAVAQTCDVAARFALIEKIVPGGVPLPACHDPRVAVAAVCPGRRP